MAKVASSGVNAGAGLPMTWSMVGNGASNSSLPPSATSSAAVSRVTSSECMLMSTPEPPVLGQGFMTCADVRRHGQ